MCRPELAKRSWSQQPISSWRPHACLFIHGNFFMKDDLRSSGGDFWPGLSLYHYNYQITIIMISYCAFKETGHLPHWARRERWAKDCWARSLSVTCCSCSKANTWVTSICTLRLFTAHVVGLGELRSSICPKIRLFSFWLVSKRSDSQPWGKTFHLVKAVSALSERVYFCVR